MSRVFALFVVAVVGIPAFAAPGEKAPSPEALAAGEQFARQLGVVAQMVAREYVRPIPSAELYAAAIAAIYDDARRPRPSTLLRDLKAAKTDNEQFEVVKRLRAMVHGAPGLEDGRDLFIAVRSFTSVLDPYSLLLPSSFLNGTTTSNSYGFEFDGEAQAIPIRNRSDRDGAALLLPESSASGGIPPIPFRVLFVKPGSPAQKAGLRPGDIVRVINGVVVDLANAAKAFAALHSAGANRNEPGVQALVVDRAGVKSTLKLRLERTDFQPESLFGVTRNGDNSWNYWLDKDRRIAYVRLAAIENDSGDRLQDMLHELRDVRGLVFDLRWCPGGYIDAATQIASTFLESGIVAKMTYRNPDRGGDSVIRADGGLVRFKAGEYPVLVLVNGDTVGGGELIAAALKDNGRAVLAGSRTFGKATIQWPMAVPGLPGYSFKLTGGTYARPNGKSLQRYPDSRPDDDWGLRPDPGYEISMSADLSRKLKEMHLLYALRPGGSREAFELDDPAADPQRLRALKLMRKLVADK